MIYCDLLGVMICCDLLGVIMICCDLLGVIVYCAPCWNMFSHGNVLCKSNGMSTSDPSLPSAFCLGKGKGEERKCKGGEGRKEGRKGGREGEKREEREEKVLETNIKNNL